MAPAMIMSVFLLGFSLCSTSLASREPMEGVTLPPTPPPTQPPTLSPTANKIKIFVRSEGCNAKSKTPGYYCGKATIKLNGIDFSPSKRGHNIVVVDLISEQVTSMVSFDTHGNNESSSEMISFLNAIPKESIVIIAIQDDGSRYLTSSVQAALVDVGGKAPILRKYRASYALLGYKGDKTQSWITQVQDYSFKPSVEIDSVVYLSGAKYIDLLLHSESGEDISAAAGTNGTARIEIIGKDVSPHGRGLNVAIIDYRTGKYAVRSFDTHGDSESGKEVRAYINGAPQESIIAVVVQDEGSVYLGDALNVLESIGGTKSRQLGYGSSYALIGFKGKLRFDWKTEVDNIRGQGPSVIRKRIFLSDQVVTKVDCDFQQGMCNWMNVDGSDNFDWTRHRGSTKTYGTGPLTDHTTKSTKTGYYLYIETDSPRKRRDNAILKSTAMSGSSIPTCFKFWYHMFGPSINRLKVSVDIMGGNKTVVWQLSGKQLNKWQRAFVPIPPSSGTFSILMEATVGYSNTGDIAIDDLRYFDKSCEIRPKKAVPPPPTAPPTPGPPTPAPPTYAPGSCGISPIPPSRVIGGKDAAVGAWPWQAALRTKYGSFFCGGSLINNQWILTAAHCISRPTVPSYYKVVLGDHNRVKSEGTEKEFSVSKLFKNPLYEKGAPINNDVALMKLSRPVKVSQRIFPVCLPTRNEVVAVGTNCFITGWGKIRHPGSSHNILQQALMPIRGKQECAERLAKSPSGSRLQITDQMVCAGYTDSSTIVSGCHGDSGGPLVCQKSTGEFQLHGSVSWGSTRCDVQERFSVFARITAMRDWIDRTIAKNSS